VEGALREGGGDESLRLIETLAWDGTGLVRGDRHLARLVRSAARLGWSCDPAAARAALCAGRAGPARLRLTLDRAGRITVEAGPLPAPAARWRLALAPARLDRGDPWLTVKSSRRAAYDAARAALPPGIDEAVLANRQGEVCDGSITTLFFDRGAGLATPPLAAGVLPGILREEMIETGRAHEAPLDARDLPRVRLWVGNSLRGLIPAVWAGSAPDELT
jgi:4-amino-4-deoxychorismate lyase